MKRLFPLVLCVLALPAFAQTPEADTCLPRVLAMNEIARGWQQRALIAEAELAKTRSQLDRLRFDTDIARQSSSRPSSASGLSEYGVAPLSSSSSDSSAKTEHVSGYTRKDGTVVQPYMRRPRSR